MTTIVCTRRCMASDSRVVAADGPFTGQKIFVLDGRLIGAAGEGKALAEFLTWARAGLKHDSRPEGLGEGDGSVSALVLDRNGMYFFGNEFTPEPILDHFFAIGSGAQAAMAAMHCGKSPIEAIEIAAKLDVNTGLPVRSMLLEDVVKPKKARQKRAA